MDLLLFKNSGLQGRRLHAVDFIKPFYMFKYLAILIPGFWYMTAFGFGSVLFAATGSKLFHGIYGFDVAQTGLMLSIPLLIGCLLGEMCAGWLTDHMVYRYAKSHGGRREPEPRINAIPLAVLCPIGIIIDGVCLSHHKTVPWIGAAFGMGIANFGLQVATTITYSYCTDVSAHKQCSREMKSLLMFQQCYKPQSSEISSILNLFRSIFSMTISFYASVSVPFLPKFN